MTLPNAASLNTYGGAKANAHSVVDPTREEDADDRNDFVLDVAGMTRMTARMWARFTGHATTPVLVSHNTVCGTGQGDPAPAHSATGVYTMTAPTTYTDELGVARAVNFQWAKAQARGSTAYHVQAEPTAANVVTVYVFNAAGTADDAAGVDFDVWAG